MQTRLEQPAALFSARSRTWMAVLAALAVIATTVLLPRLERADAAPSSVVAINVNGPAVTVNGTNFVPDSAVETFSFDGSRYCAPTPVTPVPAGTSQLRDLLNCFIWKTGNPGVRVGVNGLTTSDYDVYVWVFEDNYPATYNLSVNNTPVTAVTLGQAGAWQKLGPYRVTQTNAVTVSSSGGPGSDANISAIEIVSPDGSVGPLIQPPSPNPGGWTSDQFVDELVAGNINQALSADWLPDGRLLALGKTGSVYLINPATGATTPYFTIPNVDSSGEHGALDILVPPDFATSNVFYIYYSSLLGVAPSVQTRVQIFEYRFNANGATALASGRSIWNNDTSRGPFHIGGSITIGPDNRIYLSIGDDFEEANGQNLNNIWGKILRINRDGTIPTDNPFRDGAGGRADEIWAYGARNPFRADWDEPTGRYLIGDVGGNYAPTAYEEVNIGARGANYGWPLCEGPLTGPKNGPDCPTTPAITPPIMYYSHDTAGGCCQNASITGGEVFRSNKLPAALNGAYIFADYADQRINWGLFGTNGTIDQRGLLKATPNRSPVWLSQGPDGHIYYANFVFGAGGEIRRLRYTGPTNPPPTLTSVAADKTVGGAPLTVKFTAVVSDPAGRTISYLWNFDDGTTSTEAAPTKIYNRIGLYRPKLTITAGDQSITSDALSIQVGIPPTATITSPADNSTFKYGDTITATGSATDDETLPANALRWDVLLVHAQHTHPVATTFGNSVQVPVTSPDHSFASDTFFRIKLTVTDNDGLSTSQSIDVKPVVVTTTLRSNLPGGSTVGVDGIRQLLPFAYESVIGFPTELSMPETLCIAGNQWRMTAWSNGGAPTFTFATPAAAATLDANYTNTGPNAACPAAGTMKFSPTASRAAAQNLQGASLAQGGSVVFFFQESVPLRSVRFLIDGVARRTELAAPYDFDGGAVASATLTPLTGTTFAVGTHTIRAEATTVAGAVEIIDTTFTVTSGSTSSSSSSSSSTSSSTTSTTQPPAAGNGSLKVSMAANRSASVGLQGWPGTGRTQAYIFLDTTQSFTKVVFTLNNAAVRTETLAPWDFGGGLVTAAFPYNIGGLPTGVHTVRAVATRANGTTQTFTATFTK